MSDPIVVRRKTIYFDCETGGVEPHNPTIQLAAVAIDDETWNELGHFECKIDFDEARCSPEALAMNHYDREVWKEKSVHPMKVAGLFSRWAQPYLCVEMTSKRTGSKYWVGKLAGHNAATFDLPRLREIFGGTFFPFSFMVKDTLQRAMWFYDEHTELTRPASLKLSVIAEHLGINSDGAHDALTDVRLSVAIAKKFKELEQKGS